MSAVQTLRESTFTAVPASRHGRGLQTVTLIDAALTCGALLHRVLHAAQKRAPQSQEPLESSCARGAAWLQQQCCRRMSWPAAVVVRARRAERGRRTRQGRAPDVHHPRASHAPHSMPGDDGGLTRHCDIPALQVAARSVCCGAPAAPARMREALLRIATVVLAA